MSASRSPRQIMEMRKRSLGSSLELFFHDSPLKIVRAKGQFMYDEEGKEFLDCINNVCHVGHCNDRVVSAITKQMSELNTNCRFLHDNIITLAQRLAAAMPAGLEVCYFVNSGSEANDLALRLARSFTKQEDVVVMDHAYHGHTHLLIGVSPYKFNGKYPEPKPDTTHIAPVPDSYRGKYRSPEYKEEQLSEVYANEVQQIVDNLKANGKGVSAFLAESLQSCGGQIIPPKGYLKRVYEIIRAAGGLCIADEVQTGFGRIGTHMWAFQLHNDDVVPDIVTIGKPMGNGYPVAAVVTTKAVSDAMHMEYFNTYGGNPVSCAAGLAVLDVIEQDNLLSHAVKVGQYATSRFEELKERFAVIGEIRGAGMFIGIDLVTSRETREPLPKDLAKSIVYRMKDKGVLLSADGPYTNILKFKPPMCFTTANVDTLVEKLAEVLNEFENGLAGNTRVEQQMNGEKSSTKSAVKSGVKAGTLAQKNGVPH